MSFEIWLFNRKSYHISSLVYRNIWSCALQKWFALNLNQYEHNCIHFPRLKKTSRYSLRWCWQNCQYKSNVSKWDLIISFRIKLKEKDQTRMYLKICPHNLVLSLSIVKLRYTKYCLIYTCLTTQRMPHVQHEVFILQQDMHWFIPGFLFGSSCSVFSVLHKVCYEFSSMVSWTRDFQMHPRWTKSHILR